MTTFAELHIRPDILQGLAALGFTTPTPIQEEAIPVILRRQDDLISLAQTGTGKTAAFGIPLIQITDVASDQTQALILCPTRELCMQVARDLTAIGKFVRGLKVLPVYGGARIDLQIKALRQGMHIIVATPGRLLDLLKRRCVRIAGVTTVVLDEADEMLNMGFQEELNAILAETPATKKTLLFSATMPRAVVTITRKYMTVPVELTVGTRNAGADNIQHAYYMVHAKDRYAALKRLVDFNP
ncbi:MAG: DEAD/DEAH box helicase, partial [Deltaproteobacteria bacterium CG_4_10_14_3_um_filter_60_8]